jgi:pSer/pThr/pTyr-binding forkhead associated (FHA) protein
MVQLELTSGKNTQLIPVDTFPCNIGRAGKNTVCITSRGVWDEHASITFDSETGFSIVTQGRGTLIVNGEPADQARLKNGDHLELGSARLRFWLAPVSAPDSSNTDLLFWSLIAAVFATMIGLMLWLPH